MKNPELYIELENNPPFYLESELEYLLDNDLKIDLRFKLTNDLLLELDFQLDHEVWHELWKLII